MRHQAETVGGTVPVGERLAVELGATETTFVPGDDPVLAAQRLDLRSEHREVHEEAVAEHHHRAVAAGVLVVDVLAVDECVGHVPNVAAGSAAHERHAA